MIQENYVARLFPGAERLECNRWFRCFSRPFVARKTLHIKFLVGNHAISEVGDFPCHQHLDLRSIGKKKVLPILGAINIVYKGEVFDSDHRRGD